MLAVDVVEIVADLEVRALENVVAVLWVVPAAVVQKSVAVGKVLAAVARAAISAVPRRSTLHPRDLTLCISLSKFARRRRRSDLQRTPARFH